MKYVLRVYSLIYLYINIYICILCADKCIHIRAGARARFYPRTFNLAVSRVAIKGERRGGNFKKSRRVRSAYGEWKGKEGSNLWVYISCWLLRLMAHSFSAPGLKVFLLFFPFFFPGAFFFFYSDLTIFVAGRPDEPPRRAVSNALGLNWNSYRTFQSPIFRLPDKFNGHTLIRIFNVCSLSCLFFFFVALTAYTLSSPSCPDFAPKKKKKKRFYGPVSPAISYFVCLFGFFFYFFLRVVEISKKTTAQCIVNFKFPYFHPNTSPAIIRTYKSKNHYRNTSILFVDNSSTILLYQ